MALLVMDSVISSCDADRRIVKDVDELEDVISKVYTNPETKVN
jgi:hypothetical protein